MRDYEAITQATEKAIRSFAAKRSGYVLMLSLAIWYLPPFLQKLVI